MTSGQNAPPHFWDEMEARLEDDGLRIPGTHVLYPFPEGGGQLVKAYGEWTQS